MNITNIKLVNYRNYKLLDQDFGKNVNIIYGENAQGKTNIIEAVFLCASGRSQRTKKDCELAKNGETAYYIRIDVERNNAGKVIEILYNKEEKKRIRINEIPLKKMAELMGNLNAVIFSPEDLMIIKEGPSERRRFIDMSISQLKPAYFYDLQQYSKILYQRNILLKELQNKRNLFDTLDAWNRSLVETGARIMKERSIFIGQLYMYAEKKHEALTEGKEKLRIEYLPSIPFESKNGTNTEDIIKSFYKKLEATAAVEISKAVSLYGPHRDDFDIIINGMNTRIYGSQGQQRTSVLSLKLSEIEIIKDYTGEYPVLLLDDVMSELDGSRQEYLYNSIKDIQVFITCTSRKFFEERETGKIRYFEVKDGKVEETTIC